MREICRILLVDDNEDYNLLHTLAINQSVLNNPKIIVKNNGEEALKYLKSPDEGYPDLIFLDINMPLMDGWDLLNEYEIWKREESTFVFMVSTSNNPEDVKRAKSYRMVTDYLSKPFTADTINTIFDRYLS